ncbi:MAG: hypothetical protein KA100_06810 [Rickettsiales bacterium]|nr:hypothetical protein [Rickettsiales bacterium]
MKNQEILRELLQEKVQRALRVDKKKLLSECLKLGLSESTLYDFANYQRSYVKTATAQKLHFATRVVLG